jgi:hypothetical protein
MIDEAKYSLKRNGYGKRYTEFFILDVNVTLFEMIMFFHFNFPMAQSVDVATVQPRHFKEKILDIIGNRYSNRLLHGVTDFYVSDSC